jgi:hypothetical protein
VERLVARQEIPDLLAEELVDAVDPLAHGWRWREEAG